MDLQERFLNGVLLGNVFGRPQWQVLFIIMGCFSFATSQIRYSIPEELNKGALIGNIALDLGLDIKILRAGRARIVTGESVEYAELKADKGILVVKDRIDREHLCGDITPCSFSFEIILENPMELHQVTVEITDINDNSPVFEKKLINFEISESATIGSGFALERAFDPDVGINSLQNYVLTQNDYFILRQSPNPDGTKYVEMVLDKSLDREKKPNISLELMAVDGGNPPRSGSVNIYVTVLDANDNAPVFNQTVYRAFVMENAQKATHLITVKATDADSGTNGQILYSFSDIKEQFKDIFNINGESGAVTVVGKVDFEKDKRFEIRVKAIDRGGLTSTSKLIIEVIDVNDNAPVISVMSLSSPISEHSLPGTTIAIINVKDADSGRNGQVTCSIEKKLPFSIKSSLSNYYNLITDASLDRESKSEYNITVIVTDSGSPALSSSTLLHLKVSDINDNSPMFDQKSYSAQVPENNSPGLSVCIVTAKDLDWKQNSKVSYFLEDAHIGAASISSFISVNLESGVVQAVRSFDYEQIKQLQFVVRAQDGGSPPLSSNVTVKIKIQDQNDNAPQILYPVQSGASVVAEIVPRSADVGYLVTKVVAVDIDSGQNAWLSYKLQKATDRALFEVGAQNGEIRTVRQVTDKDAVKQRLSVVVEDNGQPPRSATVNVNVALADSFPELLSEFSDFTLHDKERNDNLTFYLVLALAVVLFLFIVSIIAILSVKCYRWRRERMFSKSGANLPVIPYYPPLYADIGGAGTSRHVYNYEVCRTADSRKSDLKYAKPCSESVISLDYSGTQTLAHGQRETLRHKEIKDQVRNFFYLLCRNDCRLKSFHLLELL